MAQAIREQRHVEKLRSGRRNDHERERAWRRSKRLPRDQATQRIAQGCERGGPLGSRAPQAPDNGGYGTNLRAGRLAGIIKRDQGAKQMGSLLHYAVVFLVVALVAAFLGFGGVAGTAMEGARILFWVAIVLFLIALIGGWMRRA
jgi:uncharacterized membrane protein YtjA (UPF0391 family)